MISPSLPSSGKSRFFRRVFNRILWYGLGIPESEQAHGPERERRDDENFLINNILQLDDKNVEDVMVPRADIVAIDIKSTLEELEQIISQNSFSRYPVYRSNPDEIVGIFHVKNLLGWMVNKERKAEGFSLEGLLVRPLFVAPSMRVLDLLLHMRGEAQTHMAMVVDEYGGIDGLVTLEDLIENIIGDIRDEHEKEKEPEIIFEEDGNLLIDGRLKCEVFEKQFGAFLREEEFEDVDTMGGLIFSIAGRVPRRGEVIRHVASGFEFRPIEVDPRRIYWLAVIFPPGWQNEISQAQSRLSGEAGNKLANGYVKPKGEGVKGVQPEKEPYNR